ncbi:MAG TPA: SAM hydroxide adenosyltransferase, partial [Nitrospiraceae bacterium]|nr:SAM hydroxide adenosyltransferase [Nitrospiraceae bacterium]
PAAAWLTKGQAVGSFGPLVKSYERLSIMAPGWEHHVMAGQIVYVDRFGNLISNLTQFHLSEVRSVTKRSTPYIRLAGKTIEGTVHSYSDGAAGVPQALINSNGQLEVFVREGNAAQALGVERGARIELA